MENIISMYGGENMAAPKQTSPSISFRPKEVQVPLPENAKIISETKDIYVQEIENGYVISMDTNVCYTCKEEGEEKEELDDRKYAYFSKKVYSKEKPIDIKIN